MKTRVLLLLSLPLLALVSACGSGDSSESARSESAPGAAGRASISAGNAGASSIGSAAGGGTSSGAAGAGSTNLNPPTIWNSAKSSSIDEAELQKEYQSWKSSHTQQCGNGSWAVVKEDSVVSEGIGYGMLLAAGMADQSLFDGLWRYYQEHLDKNGLMNWRTSVCEAPGNNNNNAATDGDLDTAMALIQAAERWPSVGYLAKAQALAGKIAQFESDMCDGRRVLRPGDAYGGCSDAQNQRINPSYFAPGYYYVFAHDFPEQAATWTALRDGSYQLYALYQARMSNLVPDWSAPDGSDDGSGYWYDACRTPFRVAVDYAWTGDTRAKIFIQNVSSWVDAHGGLPQAAQQQNSAFLGAFALSGAYDQGKFETYLSGWRDAEVDDAPYYQGTLRVLYLMVAAGKFSSTL